MSTKRYQLAIILRQIVYQHRSKLVKFKKRPHLTLNTLQGSDHRHVKVEQYMHCWSKLKPADKYVTSNKWLFGINTRLQKQKLASVSLLSKSRCFKNSKYQKFTCKLDAQKLAITFISAQIVINVKAAFWA